VARVDAKDNIYPRKERPENKIDGPVALIMAVGRAMAGEQAQESVYETPGILVF
jgi:phage terminase large subunit-like protein